jgi:hypothetical protein
MVGGLGAHPHPNPSNIISREVRPPQKPHWKADDELTPRIFQAADTPCSPGMDNTRLFIRLSAGAGTICMTLPSPLPNLENRRLAVGKVMLPAAVNMKPTAIF